MEFIGLHWKFLVTAVGMLAAWLGTLDRLLKAVEKVESGYKQARQFAKSKDLYRVAKTAYGHVSKLARKTANTLDDKAALGLEKALYLMEKLGWDKTEISNGEKDVILKVFDELHELEHLQLEAAHKVPVSNKGSASGQVAAPLAE